MFFIKLVGELLAFEATRCMERRITGKFAVRPSSIILILFAIFYAASPVDLIPECFIASWVAYTDDMVVCAFTACYVIADITAALEGRKLENGDRSGGGGADRESNQE